MNSFDKLSEATGIALPPTLAQWISNRLNCYDDWQANWRERMLYSPPALISTYDFEWVSVESSQENIDSWLNPQRQNGMRFLPFAQSGAGDAYCLIPVSVDTLAVALIWRYDFAGTLDWLGRSFDEFVYLRMLETCADFSHLVDENFSQEEAYQCLRADLSTMIQSLPEPFSEQLRSLLSRPIMRKKVRTWDGKFTENPTLLSDQELKDEKARIDLSGLPSLSLEHFQ
ncbi:MAG: SMI1/KNR4 family protein [Rhodanobacter sp.]|nr:SMI1/KNR4 family protein [Rhodanobacter sp.]